MTTTRTLRTAEIPEELTIPQGETQVVLEDGRGVNQNRRTVIRVRRGATLTYVATFAPSATLRRAIHLELDADARAELIGFVVGSNADKLTLTLDEDHLRGASWARTSVHGLLRDTAQLDLHGLVSIRPDANGSDGLFEGRAILASPDAHATIVPSLEIEARDVKATHRTAVGPVDGEQLFYLQTRGCTLAEARTLILEGFFEQLLSRLPDPATRNLVRTQWKDARI